MEEWRTIKKYPNYQVSSEGRVRHTTKKTIKTLCYNDKGYLLVNIYIGNNQCRSFAVHRLIAEMFIPNPDNLPEVNHEDGNKSNNRVSNLTRCTRSYNMVHAFQANLKKQTFSKKKTSKFLNVYFNSSKGLWMSDFLYNGKRHRAGQFKTEEEANRAIKKLKKIIITKNNQQPLL